MRISDWSSDVCSSDLRRPGGLTPPDQVAQLVRFPSGPFLAPQGAFGFLEWRRFREQNHPCAAPAERGRPRLLILGSFLQGPARPHSHSSRQRENRNTRRVQAMLPPPSPSLRHRLWNGGSSTHRTGTPAPL